MEPGPGTQFGTYQIVRKLGEGGMGAVWEAVHQGLHKRVAIKTLHASVALHADAVARFVREGRSASRIRHPHVVDVTDVGVHEGTPFLVMEFLDGEPLAALIERTGGLPIETIVALALPTLDALHAAHAAGVVHRDLKPDNIFIRRSASGGLDPVVLDFGISKVESAGGEAQLTKTSALMGTPYYMSPEQARGAKNVDARSDQFAMGLVLYEATCGRRAVEGESVLEIVHKIALADFPALATRRAGLPPQYCAVIDRMLQPKVDARFGSMREVGEALLAFGDPTTRGVWQAVFGRTSLGIAGTLQMPQADIPQPPSMSASAPPSASTFGQASRESIARVEDGSSSGVRWMVAAGLGIAVIAAAGVGAPLLWGAGAPAVPPPPSASLAAPPPVAPPPVAAPVAYTIRIGATPASAAITLDCTSLGSSPVVHDLPRDGVPHVVEVSAAGYIPHRIEFLDIAPVERVDLERVPRGHHGPVVARTSVMTATGLVPSTPAPSAAAPVTSVPPADSTATATADATEPAEPRRAAASDAEEDATDPEADAPPTRPEGRRRTAPTGAPESEGAVGANGSLIIH